MISRKDIQNLANLARIKVTDEEAKHLSSEIESILGYVGQVKEISGEGGEDELPIVRNVFREDEVTHKPGEYSKDLLALAPESEKGFVKVKKILE